MSKKKQKTILKPPRTTPGGYWLGFKYLGMPLLLGLAALDLIFYLVFRFGFDSCYGVLCLL